MNNGTKTLCFALMLAGLVLGLAGDAGAQQAQPAETSKGKTYRATLFNEWKGDTLLVKQDADYLQLNPARNSYTRHHEYQDDVIVFYKKVVAENGESMHVPAMRVPVPAGVLEPLVILVWDSAADKGLAKVIDFSPKTFPYGSYQIVNLSMLPLGGHIGKVDNTVLCQPGESQIATFDFEEGAATPIVFYAKDGEKHQKAFGSITIHKKRKRAVYLMHQEANGLGERYYASLVIVDVARRQAN